MVDHVIFDLLLEHGSSLRQGIVWLMIFSSFLTNQETEADRSSHMTSDDEQKLTSEIDEEGNKVLPAGKHLYPITY